ncbi:MAG: hypothetical protein PHO27_10885 [Sulfuricurvum sp.]|nr:hypothetical protein [Sulfuricurvum sp.]
MIFKLLILLFLPLIYIGCSTPNNALPYSLTISEEGLGAIHPTTSFEEINTKLSGFNFEKLSQISPNNPQSIFLIKRGENRIAQIISDSSGKKIAEIDILSPLIKNKHDQGIGDTMSPQNNLICIKDICHYRDEPSLCYTLDINSHIIREITYQKI